MSNAELIERVSNFAPREVVNAVADALAAADKRIAEEREQNDRMLEECANKLFAAESDYKAQTHIAASYLKSKLEAERKLAVARDALKKHGKIKHYYCEDSWYSCPKAEDGCFNDKRGPECDCGADEHNAAIEEALAQIGGEDAGT